MALNKKFQLLTPDGDYDLHSLMIVLICNLIFSLKFIPEPHFKFFPLYTWLSLGHVVLVYSIIFYLTQSI